MRAARVVSVHARRRAATLQLGPAGKSAYSLAKLALTEEEIKSIRVLRRGCATGAQRLARDRDQAFYILFPCPRLFHTVFFSGAPICAAKDCATDTQTKSALMPSATSRTPKMPSRSRSLSWAGGGLDPQRRGPGQLAARGCPAPGHELETKSTAENEK